MPNNKTPYWKTKFNVKNTDKKCLRRYRAQENSDTKENKTDMHQYIALHVK
jgi:hypothetical protein